MRAFAAYLLALALVVSPAMAAAGPAGDKDKDNTTAAKSSSTAASDDKTAGSNDASDDSVEAQSGSARENGCLIDAGRRGTAAS